MADAPAPLPATQPNLDIGKVLSGIFSVFFSNFWYFFGVTFVAMIAVSVVTTGLTMAGATTVFALGGGDGDEVAMTVTLLIFVFLLLALGFALLYIVLARSSVTAYFGQGSQFASAFGAAFAGFIPLILIGLLLAIPLALGFILLIVPGLYLAAMFGVVLPALAYERSGFGALGRSLELTSGYRWTIVGLNVIWFIIIMAINTIFQLILVLVMMAFMGPMFLEISQGGTPDPTMGVGFIIMSFVIQFLSLLVYCILVPLGVVFPSVIYSRLVEIKEGGSASSLSEVFS